MDGEGHRRWSWCLHKNTGRKATGNHLSTLPKTMARQNIKINAKEKGRKQERMENMEVKNLPNGRTLTTMMYLHSTLI